MIKLGLALGGGGSRGFAHIGVLKVFDKNKVPLHQITGCSIGAIIGGLYAYYQDAQKVESFMRDFINQQVFKDLDLQIFTSIEPTSITQHLQTYLNNAKKYFSMLRALNEPSIYSAETMEAIFAMYPDVPIESLPIHFASIATDLISGREIVINQGSLRQAIIASASIPGIFPPLKTEDQLLIDGGASDSIPVQIVKGQGAQYVLAVDVTKSIDNGGDLENGLEIIYRTEDIVSYHLTQERLTGVDLLISPNVKDYSWAAVNQIDEIIDEGAYAAQEALPIIQKFLPKAKI